MSLHHDTRPTEWRPAAGEGGGCVVVGIDGSLSAMRAVAYAAGLAQRNRSTLVLTHVRRPLTLTICECVDPYLEEDLDFSALMLVSDLQLSVQRDYGIEAKAVVRRGQVVNELSRLANEVHADAVVVGGPQGIIHRRVGALGSRLARRANWPVTVVP